MKEGVVLKQLFRRTTFKFNGQSMSPLFVNGTELVLEPATFKSIQTGEILLFKQNGDYIAHRALYKTKRYLICKGDNNLRTDAKVKPTQVIARIDKFKKDGKLFRLSELYLLQSSIYLSETIKLVKAFQKGKVKHLFLKGLPLHLRYHKRIPWRIYYDCDLLIAKQDLSQVAHIFKALGYQKVNRYLSKTHEKMKNKESEINFYKRERGVPVFFDIHLEIVFLMTQLGDLDPLYPKHYLEELNRQYLESRKEYLIGKNRFFLLSTHHQIIYLALHIFHHNFRGAFRYETLDQVIRNLNKKSISWSALAAEINQYQLGNYLFPVFSLCQKYYHTPISNTFFRLTKQSRSSRQLAQALQKTGIFNEESRLGAGMRRFYYLFLLSPNSIGKKLTIFLRPIIIYSLFWFLLKRIKTFFESLTLFFKNIFVN